MKNNLQIALLIENMFNEFEVIYPYYRLLEAGVGAVVVGPRKEEYHSKAGLTIAADKAVSQVKASGLDGVIIPGGFAPDYMRVNRAMVTLVRQLDRQGKLVAAICHGGWMLASAQIINGREMTSVPNIKDDMLHAGGLWQDKEVVVAGNLITSRRPSDMPAFMREVLKFLNNKA
ncbi:MAG: type 1 glutamine amidotransferase [Desulfarculales bacterium]|jgi:protease I|nr:type 1 glutamine amidotransferase [Desulfarculales bacterium]